MQGRRWGQLGVQSLAVVTQKTPPPRRNDVRALTVLHIAIPILQAELLQQFALLQQTESEAKRQSDDDRALVLHMYHTVSQQLDDIRAQLHKRDREDGSTAATLGQVLGVVRNNGSILGDVQAAQKRVDTRTAQAVQHAKAAAASAAAAQQQQGALAEGIKVRSYVQCPQRWAEGTCALPHAITAAVIVGP